MGDLVGRWMSGRRQRLIALLITLAIAPLHALAQDAAPSSNPAATAQAAAEIVDLHCAEVAGGQATESAEALTAVTPVLAQVSRAHDATGETYLLYWRGVLGACVGQEERAIADLGLFIEGVEGDAAYAAQLKDARARLRRLTRGSGDNSSSSSPIAGVVLGSTFLGGGGVLGGLAGWQARAAQDSQAAFSAGLRPWGDTDAIGQDGEDSADASNALLAGSIGSAVAGAVAIAISAATSKKVPSASAVLVPMPEGGAALRIGGRW